MKDETIQNMSLARPNGGGPPPIWGQLIATSGTLWGMAPPQRCTAVQCTSFHQLVQNKTSWIYQNISAQMSSCSKFFSTLRRELIYLRSHHQTNTVFPKYLCFYWWSISKYYNKVNLNMNCTLSTALNHFSIPNVSKQEENKGRGLAVHLWQRL